MLKAGDAVPRFNLASGDGSQVDSRDLIGREYLLFLYPRDNTPGCTREACAFRDALPELSGLGLDVFGVSADSAESHARFAQKQDLNFPLLSDPDRSLIDALGAWVEKSLYGRKFMGIQRSSFLVDATGRIAKAWPKVSPNRHAAEVAAWLRQRDAENT